MVGRLELLRGSIGLNQADFADRLGLQPGSYSDIKKGKLKSGVSKKILRKLETEFNVNIDWLKTGNGEMFIPAKAASLPPIENPAPDPTINKPVYDVYTEIEQLKVMVLDLKAEIRMLLEKSLSDGRVNEILARAIEESTKETRIRNELLQGQSEGNPSKNYMDKAG